IPGDPAYGAAPAAGSGYLRFDSSGKITNVGHDLAGNVTAAGTDTGTVTITPTNGAAAFTILPDFNEISGLDGEYTANAADQDGSPFGTLQSYAIGDDGTISGIFSNGV